MSGKMLRGVRVHRRCDNDPDAPWVMLLIAIVERAKADLTMPAREHGSSAPTPADHQSAREFLEGLYQSATRHAF